MKSIPALVAALLFPAAVFAQSTQPAAQPAPAAAVQPAEAGAKVAIMAFTPVELTDPDWIGRAVQQSLVADLSRGAVPIQAMADASKVTTLSEAVDAGKRLDARYIIFGTYQNIEPNLRITGQIVDSTTGKVVAGLKSTGSVRDLFDMQDNLAFQAKWGLGTERLNEKATAKAEQQPAPEKPALQPQGPIALNGDRYADSDLSRAVADGRSIIQREDAAGSSFREQTYNPEPYYPGGYYGYGWGWGYPYANWWWGNRVVIIRDHDHDHDHHHHHHDKFFNHGDGRDYSKGFGNTMGSYRMTMQSAPRNYNQAPRNYNQFQRNYNVPNNPPTIRSVPMPRGGVGSGGARMVSSPMRGGGVR